MTTNDLIAALLAIRAPAGTEEWLQPIQPDSTTSAASTPLPSEDYRHAVRDVLTALGVLMVDRATAGSTNDHYSSPMAYYFVQSLLASIRDGSLTPVMWQGLAGNDRTGTGARLVHLLEAQRLADTDQQQLTPLRVVAAVAAVIKARGATDDVYLMQYDHKAEQFQPIGGKCELTDANNEAALIRELCEELEIETLTEGSDLHIHPIAEHLHSDTVSATVHVVTRYDHSFYHLTDIRFPLPLDAFTRWLTAAELKAGKTTDGYNISRIFETYIPGLLPTLGYSLPDRVI